MKREVLDYLNNLNSIDLPREEGIIQHNDSIKRVKYVKNNVAFYQINDKFYYGKIFDDERTIEDIATRKMYANLGIPTPQVSLVRLPREISLYPIHSFSPDVKRISVYTVTPADLVLRPLFNESKKMADKWEVLTNHEIRYKLLSVMTEECLNQIIDIYLLGELRSEIDIHMEQYFLTKLPNEDRYTGIIPIDMDNTELMYKPPIRKTQFKKFLQREYVSYTITEQEDYLSYAERIEKLRDLLFHGTLSSRHIKTLRKGVNYDFPGEIKKACNDNGMKHLVRSTYTPYARLWGELEGLSRDLDA